MTTSLSLVNQINPFFTGRLSIGVGAYNPQSISTLKGMVYETICLTVV